MTICSCFGYYEFELGPYNAVFIIWIPNSRNIAQLVKILNEVRVHMYRQQCEHIYLFFSAMN
jgi:hypothetical protein